MFEQRKTIKVNGVSFDMILVEGDKFSIGDKEYELEDFYMAEIPVTQELYMAIMGSAHTGSYSTSTYNYNDSYTFKINPVKHLSLNILRNETVQERQKRIEREWEEQRRQEQIEEEIRKKERERQKNFEKKLPVNNVSWTECIEFINNLNKKTGLYFALPSFEQWYFAASGGILSKGYNYAGSNDPNTIGHFHKILETKFSPGLYVMTGETTSINNRKAPTNEFQWTKTYKPNELGIFDMSGLVHEWLDEAGKVIGGSFHSDPEKVSKIKKYGFSDFRYSNNLLNDQRYRKNLYITPNIEGNFYGFRLVLLNKSKNYIIPQPPSVKTVVSDQERSIISLISSNHTLGLLRSVISNKFEKEKTIHSYKDRFAFSKFQGNVYNIFIGVRNLPNFKGSCFNKFLSRRSFIDFCKYQFVNMLIRLDLQGYNLLIHDELGLNLETLDHFNPLQIGNINIDTNLSKVKDRINILKSHKFITNNIDILKIENASSFKKDDKGLKVLKLASNSILIEIKDTFNVQRVQKINNEWLYSTSFGSKIPRISFNCFCDFNGELNDFEGCHYPDGFISTGIVRFMTNHIKKPLSRFNIIDFDNSSRVNLLFCKKNKGGLYEYDYPTSSGLYLIQDERFFILPQEVYDELKANLV